MSGSTAAVIVIPIVVAIVLFGWVAAVLRADSHPQYRHHEKLPKYEVTGGAFQSVDGGRQLMPIPGERPIADRPAGEGSHRVPAQRSASSTTAGESRSAAEGGASAQEEAVGGTRLRLATSAAPATSQMARSA
jgi:hypothetical protein